MPNLTLSNCQTLRSLEGLESPNGFGKKGGILKIYNCPRLVDFGAMEGMDLSSLEITGGYVLPEEWNFRTGAFLLDSVAGIENLDFLNEMDNSQPVSFKFVGIEGLENLKPLERFHGTFITVSPELEEQAKDLVQAGNFNEYHIEYPQGGWELDNSGLTLLSLDELETLPDALLRRVERFSLAGDAAGSWTTPDSRCLAWTSWRLCPMRCCGEWSASPLPETSCLIRTRTKEYGRTGKTATVRNWRSTTLTPEKKERSRAAAELWRAWTISKSSPVCIS